jgi:uncharacterized DUF497 family protein
MNFEWDGSKAAANRRKHGVLFDEAEDLFSAAAIFEDFDHSEVEPRYLAIGFSAKGRMLTVVFTRPAAGVYRIISARKANKREQQRYGKAKRENS